MITRILIASLGLAAISVVQAKDKDTGQLLANMRRVYGSVKSARFSTEFHTQAITLANTIYYSAPMRVRGDITSIAGGGFIGVAVVLTDGKSMSAKNPAIMSDSTRGTRRRMPVLSC